VPVIIVILVHTVNMINHSKMAIIGETEKFENGYYIVDFVTPGGPVDQAGIIVGDTLVCINSYPIEEWASMDHNHSAGDTLIFGILRNKQEIGFPVVLTSRLSMSPGFYWTVFFIIILVSTGSLYLLYKKPGARDTLIFFLYIQQLAALATGGYYLSPDPLSLLHAIGFQFSSILIGPTLVHFHLIFPKPVKILSRYKRLPMLFYLIGFLMGIPHTSDYIYNLYFNPGNEPFSLPFEIIVIWWGSITGLIALAIAIFQFVTSRDTLTRNQLRIIVIGSFPFLVGTVFFASFYDNVYELWGKYPNFLQILQGTCSIFMISCILIAIFRYRIWDIEAFIRKALLYLGATIVIILSYLLLLFLVDILTIGEIKATRFIILAISVIIFLVLRDWLQRMIDRIFHRETYDSATVVSDFEEKLAGIYQYDELKCRIVQGLDEIFHFKSFILNLKKEELTYETAFVLGLDNYKIDGEFKISRELENKLQKSGVFSPGELEYKTAIVENANGELIVPLLKDDKTHGFFICGPKQSEKTYSIQDIRVLSLIAKRVIALFHTANLYQKDLDRQLMLERERARISQDMHDDIGAGLTKIAMISEAGASEKEPVSSERMIKVASTARGMINRLNVIVWALNPRYDNLDSLISYTRRYFGEYLENFGIDFKMQVSGDIPDLPVSPDFRRNAFYAWQEAIHNAVKHSACSEIKIEMEINGQTMLVTIADNGKGFDQIKPGSGGNGMMNMKKRAEELGGTFEIESEPGKGTRVVFRIPVVI
jgi:signal transduction histidine kinase